MVGKYSVKNNFRVSNSLDLDQARHNSIVPDLGLNCLQRSSADDKFTTSRQRINHILINVVFYAA